MPTYEYEVLGPEGEPRAVFEVRQKMSDPPLTEHPETGEPVRRILSATFAHGSTASAPIPCGAGQCGTDACGLSAGMGCGGGN